MKDTNVKLTTLSGLYEAYPQPADHLTELVNWAVDPYTGGWTNKIGFEKYASYRTNWTPFPLTKIDSMFYVQKHQGAQDSLLLESGGTLYILDDFRGGLDLWALSENRSLPKSSEIGTQYAQFGRFTLFTNGYDRPSKSPLYPINDVVAINPMRSYPLGFNYQPSAPVVWSIEDDPSATAGQGDTQSIWFTHNNLKNRGLGGTTSGDDNKYKYKVTFINNAGAESPISAASSTIAWTTPATRYRFAQVMELPIGEAGTIARRVYRTKNFGDAQGNDGDTFYYVGDVLNNEETFYIDDIPDSGLGSLAPNASDSIVFPSLQCRYFGIYKDCLFIDGGRSNDTTLFFSNPTVPDQFGATNFLSLGHREGGGITGMFGYFNFMLAFRENSIDIIRGDYPNFVATNLINHIGTRATNTICAVPELGIVFLGRDGLYAVGGNPEYGQTPAVQKITTPLQDTFARLNVDAMHRATAVYSAKRREYMVFFPVDGQEYNSIGVVYHTDKKTFSIREEFPVGSLVKNSDGDVYFGWNKDVGLHDDPHGVQVISARRCRGQVILNDVMVDDVPPLSKMSSAWLDLGDMSAKKKIHSVYLFIATGGDQDFSLEYYTDFNWNDGKQTQPIKQQRPDFKSQGVYDKVSLDLGDYWEEPLVTTIRYDVHSAACSQFLWRLATQADAHIIGYAIDFTANGTRVIQGKRL